MAGKDNLTSWEKGTSGNPKGKPKGSRNRSTIIKEILAGKATDGGSGTVADQMTRALARKAAEGDTPAFKELMDGAFGKISDKVENTVTYTKMGTVLVDDNGETKALEFDVGQDPNKIKDKSN